MSDNSGDAIGRFWTNLKDVPRAFVASFLRHALPENRRTRAQIVISNVFLHIHSARTHRHSLRVWYTAGLGVMSMALFVLLSITGLLLMVYYKPSTAEAYNSVKDIIFAVPSGRMIRNLHRWGAHLMVVAVFLHMGRVFYTSSYKQGRAFNWLVGLSLLVLTFALAFTGYLLPWDQLAFWAVTIGSNIAASLGELTDAVGLGAYADVGGFMRRLLLGSDSIADEALLRFYFLHCVLLPIGIVGLIAVHFWRIRKDGGLTRPADIREDELRGLPEDRDHCDERESLKTYSLMAVVRGDDARVEHTADDTVPSWPHAFSRELIASMAILAVTLVLAYFFDAPLKEAANPSVPENPAKAPWYFLGLQELVSYSAFIGGVGLPMLALFGLGLIPYVDRDQSNTGRWLDGGAERGLVTFSVVFAVIANVLLLAFTVRFGWLRQWWPKIPQLIVILLNPGTLLAGAFAAFSLWMTRRHNSIRAGAVALFTCFVVAFVVLTYFATVHRGPNWMFYWWPSLWPTH